MGSEVRTLLRGKSIDGIPLERWWDIRDKIEQGDLRDRIGQQIPKRPLPDISNILPYVPDIKNPEKDERPSLYIEDEVPPEYDPNQENPEPKKERGEVVFSMGYAGRSYEQH